MQEDEAALVALRAQLGVELRDQYHQGKPLQKIQQNIATAISEGATSQVSRRNVPMRTAVSEAALIQVTKAKMVPIHAKQALVAFLQQAQPDVEAMPADQVAQY